jgi:2-iminobutanoate/2-iminopropanoate deaminase
VREQIHAADAPPGAGPYSHAMRGAGLVFTAGQLGVDPQSGELVGDAAADQARQALANVETILRAAGSGMDRILKVTVFLADIADWQAVNKVYAAEMPQPFPARSAFAVRELPRRAKVEIECVALAGEGSGAS